MIKEKTYIKTTKILAIVLVLLFVFSSIFPVMNAGSMNKKTSVNNSNTIVCETDDYDLLIITIDSYVEPLNKLKTHKESFGIRTNIVTVSQIYQEIGSTGRDNPEKIKYYIKNCADLSNIEFVLLVGNFKKVPVRYVHNQDVQQGFNEPTFISELYYADIYDSEGGFSSWDSDGDGVFGEWIDDGVATEAEDKDIDLYPDVYVGRLACRNKVEVKTMVDKIITYETGAYGQDWSNRIVVAAGDTYPKYPTNEGEENTKHVLENMSDYDQTTLWTSDGTLTGVQDIIREINKGCGFLYFDGHANPFQWSTHPPEESKVWIRGLSILTMSLLMNKNMYPICVVGGCHNNQFDVHLGKLLEDPYYYFTFIPECWGWKLTRKIGGGSIATIGCSGLGMTKEDKDSFRGAGDFLEPSYFYEIGVNKTEYLGMAWGNAISGYLDEFPIDWNTPAAGDYAIDAKSVQQSVLLGDPSLKIGGYDQ